MTGIDKRDEHMRERYLEVAKFPIATLELKPMPAFAPGKGAFEGVLDLHGNKRPVSGSIEIRKRQQAFEVEGDFQIKLGDFGIAIPKFAGITVAEDVAIHVVVPLEEVR